MNKIIVNSLLKIIFIIFLFELVICEHSKRSTDIRFKSKPTTVKTYENDTVLLPCYHNSPIRYIRWLRDGELLADSRHPELLPPERTRIWTNGSLQINFVHLDDTGEYLCEVMTAGGLAKQIHAIEVQFPPTAISTPGGPQEVRIGSVFEIICDARGVPQPIITWKLNGEIVQDHIVNSKKFLVDVRDREMAGSIDCYATNGVGEPAVAGINLIVLFEPEVKATTTTVHTKIGIRTQLECHTTANPPATVHWFKKDNPVIKNNQISIHSTELTTNKTSPQPLEYLAKHVLTLKHVKDVDLGMYECRAENKIGYTRAHIELTGRPMIPIFKQSPPTSEPLSHNFLWQTESLSPIIEYLLKFRIIPSGNITPNNRFVGREWKNITIPSDTDDGSIHSMFYSLRGLTPASVFEVAVKARNKYGWSDMSQIKRFATGGEIQFNYSTETLDYETEDEDYVTAPMTPTEFYASSSTNKFICMQYLHFSLSLLIAIFYNLT